MGIPTPTPPRPRLLIIFLLFLTELHTYQARLKHTMLPGHPKNSLYSCLSTQSGSQKLGLQMYTTMPWLGNLGTEKQIHKN